MATHSLKIDMLSGIRNGDHKQIVNGPFLNVFLKQLLKTVD